MLLNHSPAHVFHETTASQALNTVPKFATNNLLTHNLLPIDQAIIMIVIAAFTILEKSDDDSSGWMVCLSASNV